MVHLLTQELQLPLHVPFIVAQRCCICWHVDFCVWVHFPVNADNACPMKFPSSVFDAFKLPAFTLTRTIATTAISATMRTIFISLDSLAIFVYFWWDKYIFVWVSSLFVFFLFVLFTILQRTYNFLCVWTTQSSGTCSLNARTCQFFSCLIITNHCYEPLRWGAVIWRNSFVALIFFESEDYKKR